MAREIRSVAVIGGGTMGGGIAGAVAQAGFPVLLLESSRERAEKALDRIVNGRPPAVDDADAAARIAIGTVDEDLGKLADYDWVCEAIVEDLAAKRALFGKIEPLRKPGSVVSTNTSGIPLRTISEGMPESFRRDVCVTHYFNPVKVMKLLELVPDTDTDPEVIEALAAFNRAHLGKGVVFAKDTVNFIGNRIGCFWMLSGLHKAKAALKAGLTQETIDALMGRPVGLPSTGLYGLIDLIGLDIMDLVGKNLSVNLPEGDAGRAFTALPHAEQAMLARGQLGRKTGAGFYRMLKAEDGSRRKETFDLTTETWREAEDAALTAPNDHAETLLFAETDEGRFAWDLMGGTLAYAADLVPEISDDIVNIDRAMRWGFSWGKGPFELMDAVGPAKIAARIEAEGRPLPAMLQVLKNEGGETFYGDGGASFLGRDGVRRPVPQE
ncbi:3-hydroxyacyl-CoA dehydrogenase family protein [Futiania mangrovi]|uniref:3-hydroxyacyl-CoA dehydrogenase family protein n=1 Tax=Futiania mangrovi TaxID=2959716 RepID=A0A9J6P8X3_9PROT|nr:3-hydroxyacyl-CoA dehydrogenase family protein [Futiania mangrovii]MCP1336252.1 3-hydroxyacyl-CoA dehydrogenase family protein [Futiania mangrovii]